MPEPVSRSIGSGFASPAYPIIANNPAFKVEMIPLDNRMEQKNTAKPNDNEVGAIKMGDIISGEVLGKTQKEAKKEEGRVVAIDKEDDTVLSFRVVTTDGEEVNIDPTTAAKVDNHPEDFSDDSQPGSIYTDTDPVDSTTDEKRIMNYQEWLVESRRIEEMAIPANKWVDVDLSKIDEEELEHIWKMYTNTYAKEGLDFSADDKNELRGKYKATFLKDVDNDNQSDAFLIYKPTAYGNKIALLGTNDKKEAKREVIRKVIELLNTRGWFLEASMKMEDILSKSNVPVITDEKMILDIVGKGKEPEMEKNGYYTRFLSKAHKKIRKRMYGIPR